MADLVPDETRFDAADIEISATELASWPGSATPRPAPEHKHEQIRGVRTFERQRRTITPVEPPLSLAFAPPSL